MSNNTASLFEKCLDIDCEDAIKEIFLIRINNFSECISLKKLIGHTKPRRNTEMGQFFSKVFSNFSLRLEKYYLRMRKYSNSIAQHAADCKYPLACTIRSAFKDGFVRNKLKKRISSSDFQ